MNHHSLSFGFRRNDGYLLLDTPGAVAILFAGLLDSRAWDVV